MSTPGCSCEITDILSYNKSNNTLTIKADLVVEGNGSQAAIKMGSSAKPANLWVIGGVDIGDIPGYANTGDLRVQKDVTVGTDLFVNNNTILGATVAPSGLPDKHLFLNGNMDIGNLSDHPWAGNNSLQVKGNITGDVFQSIGCTEPFKCP